MYPKSYLIVFLMVDLISILYKKGAL